MAIDQLFQAVFPCTLFSAGWVAKSHFKNMCLIVWYMVQFISFLQFCLSPAPPFHRVQQSSTSAVV